jgi:hypothetical protein
MTTAADIANRALQEIAAQATVTGAAGSFTGAGGAGSAAAAAANILYAPAVLTVLRMQDWEFARREGVTLATDGNTAPAPWTYEYAYPADCVRLLQVVPASPSANDPQPVAWSVAEVTVSAAPAKAILSNTASALATYTTSSATEAQWDAMFAETVVRFLASELAMSLGGRPDFSVKMLEQSGQIAGQSTGRDS